MRRFVGGVVMLLLAAWCGPAAGAGEAIDAWRDLRPLVGHWSGRGAGFGTESVLTHDWAFVIDGRFLRLTTRSVSRRKDGTEEVHEDVGYVSRDSDRGVFVFRQFLSEGFVNTFDLAFEEGPPRAIVFGERASESAGGMRARMRLVFVPDSGYDMVLDLAGPGKDFVACQRMHLERLGEAGR